MEVLVNVIGQKLRIATNCKTYVDGTRNFVKFVFILPDEWNGLEKTAQFIQDGEAYNRELSADNSVYLPDDIHGGKCELVLKGTSGLIVALTDALQLNIKGNCFSGEGQDNELVFATIAEMKEYLQI